MELPEPHIDALGRVAWSGTPSDVSKAYRKLSALVHPDKNPHPEARTAFEVLNKAHRILRDPGTLVIPLIFPNFLMILMLARACGLRWRGSWSGISRSASCMTAEGWGG